MMENKDTEHRCGKCWSFLDPTDSACRKCGLKTEVTLEEPQPSDDFDPRHNISVPVYGPPPVKDPMEQPKRKRRWLQWR
jgi:predicted amidophosphoribosyltransferase